MKRNILTIIAIALSLVNVILTAVIMFSIVPTAKATNNLIANVASIIDLELESGTAKESIPMSDLEAITFENGMQINLKSVPGDKMDHFAVIDKVSVYLNKKADDFKTLNESIKNYESTISEIVSYGFSQYTKEEVQNNREAIKEAVLSKIQEKFGTQTIADISFKNLRLQ